MWKATFGVSQLIPPVIFLQMPIGWFPQIQPTIPPSATFKYEGLDLTYWADRTRMDEHQVLRLDGNVKVNYGEDTLTADHFEAHGAPTERFLVASGRVQVVDPDGMFSASEVRITWDPLKKSAFAKNVLIKIAGATVRAETADILPGKWVLTKYYVTLDKTKRPLAYVKGDRLEIVPGKNAVLSDSQIYLLGQRIIGFKERTFSLNSQATGFHLPTLEYRSDKGLGYNWTVGAIIDPNTAIQLHSDASFKDLPGYGGLLTKSFVPTKDGVYPIAPHSEFALRFDFSYMDSVLVEKPSQEIAYFDHPRKSLSFESTFNASAAGRADDREVYSVPASLEYELGGKLGSTRYISQFKIEDIDSYRRPYQTRALWLDSLELSPKKLGPNLYNISRIDSGVYQSSHNYFWVRGTDSLVLTPNKNLTLSGALFGAIANGDPDLDIDPLHYHNGVALRSDYRLGPRRLSLLFRYDTQLGLFDKEFVFTQAIGPLEAFISRREYPGDSHFGVMLRVDQFEDLLERRNFKKSSKSGINLP